MLRKLFSILLFSIISTNLAFAAQDFHIDWSNTTQITDSEKFRNFLNYRVDLLRTGLAVISDHLDLTCELNTSQINVPEAQPGLFWGYKAQKWSVKNKITCQNTNVVYLDFREGFFPTSPLDDCYLEPTRILLQYKEGDTTQFWVTKADRIYNWKNYDDFRNPASNSDTWQTFEVQEASKKDSDYGDGFGKYFYTCW